LAYDPEVDETEEAWFDRVKKQIKEKLLESYRNGQKRGSKSGRHNVRTSLVRTSLFVRPSARRRDYEGNSGTTRCFSYFAAVPTHP